MWQTSWTGEQAADLDQQVHQAGRGSSNGSKLIFCLQQLNALHPEMLTCRHQCACSSQALPWPSATFSCLTALLLHLLEAWNAGVFALNPQMATYGNGQLYEARLQG